MLRARPHLQLRWADLPTGVRGLFVSDGTIVLDVALNREQRNATLLHELIHAERGVTGNARTDERGVDDEVARRLVPLDELAALKEIAELNELTVDVWMVAERWDVPVAVAERAMRLLLNGGQW